jgi:hypothetical protein
MEVFCEARANELARDINKMYTHMRKTELNEEEFKQCEEALKKREE